MAYYTITIKDAIEFVRHDAELAVRFNEGGDQRVVQRHCSSNDEAMRVSNEAAKAFYQKVEVFVRQELAKMPKAQP